MGRDGGRRTEGETRDEGVTFKDGRLIRLIEHRSVGNGFTFV